MEHGVLAEPVLVGRERELAELQRHLQLAMEGKGATVFVSGEAGCGKTRLISEFLDVAKKKDVLILAGWCLSNAAQPYFPFVEAFESYSPTADSGLAQQQELKSWLVGRGQAEGREIAPQVWKDQTYAAITKELLYMSTNKPIILFIDDVHWADSASLALLHYIARAITSERLLVVATFRTEEITAKLEGHPHPLAEAIRLMAREELFKEIKLQNLNKVNVGKIAENMLGGSLDKIFVERLSEESHGNPLFVVEALRTLYSQGSLMREHGQWHLTNETIGIPAKVKDVIMRRLDALKPSQRRILDAASVVGEKFDPKLVAGVFPQDNIDVLEALNAVAQSTLLVSCEGNNYRFKHAKIQEMLYNEIPPLLKKEYHSRIAAILEANSQNVEPFPFGDVAYHYAQAGNKEKSVKYALAAGKDELARWSNVQAIKHFEYVLQNVPEGHAEEKRAALEGLGDAYAANSRYSEAIKTFDELAASETGAVRLRALRKAMDAAYAQGDKPDLLLEYAKKAEESGVKDRLEMARVLSNRGRAYGWAGHGDLRLDLADYDSALKVFEEENSLPDVAEALLRSGQVSGIFFEDLSKKGLGKLLRSVAIFRELGDVRKEIEATRWAGAVFYGNRLYQEAGREYSSALAIGEKSGLFVELAQASIYLGEEMYELKGRIAEALSQSLRGLEFSKKTDAKWMQGLAYAYLTRQYCLLGDLKHADEYFDKMNKLPPGVLSNLNLLVIYPRTKGVYFAAHAQWEESKESFEKFLEFIENRKMHSFETFTRRDYAWALERQGRFDDARVQWDRVQKLLDRAEEKFRRAEIQFSLLLPRKVLVGEEFTMRIDLVNVANNAGTLVRLEGVIPSGFKLASLPSFCAVRNDSVELNQKKIGSFQVETIKLRVVSAKRGAYKIEPCLFYVDDLGESRKTKAEPITVTVQPGSSEAKLEAVAEPVQGKFEFKSEAAEKAFNFLVSAFEEDYVTRRLPLEKSGWRTLMEVAKNAQVTMYSMYGRYSRGGKAALELEHLGLVESRFFLGERGRGGQVIKMRICYEKENVKRQIGRQIDR